MFGENVCGETRDENITEGLCISWMYLSPLSGIVAYEIFLPHATYHDAIIVQKNSFLFVYTFHHAIISNR